MPNAEPKDLAPLAALVRNDLNESFHFGIAVLVSPSGEVLEEHGNGSALIYPRSALKPLQALTLQRLGLKLPARQSVMSMASHYSTPAQIDQIRAILESRGVAESELGCPAALPWNPEAKAKVNQAAPIYHNCSGKHAGFLAACAELGFGRADYLSTEHPIQLAIKDLIEELSGEKVGKTAIDGCGAPLHAITTIALARAISGFMLQGQALVAAAVESPELIGDVTTPDAAFLRAGLFSKLGAEGVFTVGTESGHAAAIKIADGSLRAAPAIALSLLEKHGLVGKEEIAQISKDCVVEVLGGGKSVGELKVLI